MKVNSCTKLVQLIRYKLGPSYDLPVTSFQQIESQSMTADD